MNDIIKIDRALDRLLMRNIDIHWPEGRATTGKLVHYTRKHNNITLQMDNRLIHIDYPFDVHVSDGCVILHYEKKYINGVDNDLLSCYDGISPILGHQIIIHHD